MNSSASIQGTVYGTLLNYRGVLAALGDAVHQAPYKAPPQAPVLYVKTPNTYRGADADVEIPLGSETVEVGAALGLVFGRDTYRVNAGNATTHVCGYIIAHDITLPHASVFRPAVTSRNRDGFCPLGPCITPVDDIADANSLTIAVSVNGRVVQENSTANLVRPTEQLIADVSAFMTLRAGDVLLVGTPESPPQVGVGDVVATRIDGLGELTTRFVAESAAGARK